MAQEKMPLWVLLTALAGGGSTSAILPRIAPEWYRPDPATGQELRDVKRELDQVTEDLEKLNQEFRRFLVDGPRRVVENQTRIEGKLDTVLNEIRRRGEEHRNAR